jgi:hypothetical protein
MQYMPKYQAQMRETEHFNTVVRSEVVTAVLLKIYVFWDVAPCPLINS